MKRSCHLSHGSLSTTLFFISLFMLAFCHLEAQVLPFPGAVGWGSVSTTGGRGGTVYHVTNLNDSGAGSFRDAVSQGSRIIVFDVGGYILVNSALAASSNITIAGETAPGDGIGFYGAEVSFTGRSNCIVRHVRFRQGSLDPKGTGTGNSSGNCINLGNTANMIFDHCSLEFASYNNVDAVNAVNLTFQYCIFADAIKSQQFACHFQGGPATFIDCLWANVHNRCPLAKGNLQYVNNVLYDYQAGFTAGDTSGHFYWDIINNYFIAGPVTSSAGDCYFQVPGNCYNYAAGNILDGNRDGTLGGSSANNTGATGLTNYYFSSTSTVPTASLPILPVKNAFVTVVANAGALPHDQVDTLVVNQVLSLGSQGSLYGDQTSSGLANDGYGIINGGAAPVDSDGDGMPDYWEDAFGTNLAATGTNGALNDGYPNLEQYFHWLAGPHQWAQVNMPKDIDLARYLPGFTGVTYTVTSGSNGTTTLNGDGHTAHFVPSSSTFKGMANFSFTATALGGSYTNTVSVLVSPDSPPPPPVPVLWQGGTSSSGTNVWNNVSSNTVWQASIGSIGFTVGDPVTFDDTSSNPSVTVGATVSPASIFINNNNQNYTIGGSGTISGTGNLIKTGTGTLTLSTADSYSGGTTINNSTVVLGNYTAFGTGSITLNGSTIIYPSGGALGNALTIFGSSTLTATSSGANYLYSSILGSNVALTLNTGVNTIFTLQNDCSGFRGTVSMAQGTLRIYSSTTANLGGIQLSVGSAIIKNHNSTGATYTFGSISGGASASLQGSDNGSGTDIYSIGSLNLNSTFAGAIVNGSHTLSITKTGTGTLTLSGISSYTGATTVSSGTLLVTGALGNTAATVTNGAQLVVIGSTAGTSTVQSGGQLSGSGTFSGAITAQSNSTVSPGTTAGAGAVMTAAGGLAATATTFLLDLTSSASGTNDSIAVTGGSGTLTGTTTFQINLVDHVLGAGNYKLINCAPAIPLTLNGATLKLANILTNDSRQNISLNSSSSGTAGGYVQLSVTGTAGQLLWTGGSNSNTWDLKNTVNWSGGTSADNRFYNFDAVTFNDSSNAGTVMLIGTLAPSTTIVSNNSTSYNFSGPGVLAGNQTLVKSGAGTLTLTPSSTSVSSTTVSGSSTVTVSDATGLGIGMTVSGTGIVTGTTITAISGTNVALSQNATGSGTMTLTGIAASSFSGGTTINGGTIVLTNSVANQDGLGTGAITFNGGTLTLAGYPNDNATAYWAFTNNLIVPTGATGTLNITPRMPAGAPYPGIYGTLTGGGTLNLSIPFIRDGIAGDWSGFTGTLNVTTPGSGSLMLATSYANPGLPQATVNLGDNVTMLFSGTIYDGGTEVDVGALSGTSASWLTGGPTSSGGRPFTWGVGTLNTDATFAGTIADQASYTSTSFIKYGTGNWTLSGTCNFNGTMIVEAGTLSVAGTVASGDIVDIQSGATLNLAGGNLSGDSVTVDVGASLTGAGTIATSLENDGTVLCSSGGTLSITGDVVNNGTMRLTGGTTLNATGNFINNGVLDLLTGAGGLPANFYNNGIVIDSSAVKLQDFSKNGNAFTMTINSYSGHNYQLQRSSALGSPTLWQNVGLPQAGITQSNGTPTVLTFTDSNATGQSWYYRIQISP